MCDFSNKPGKMNVCKVCNYSLIYRCANRQTSASNPGTRHSHGHLQRASYLWCCSTDQRRDFLLQGQVRSDQTGSPNIILTRTGLQQVYIWQIKIKWIGAPPINPSTITFIPCCLSKLAPMFSLALNYCDVFLILETCEHCNMTMIFGVNMLTNQ